ncbi:MAG: DUF6572 domain-containing protein [Halieaceae bacterium]
MAEVTIDFVARNDDESQWSLVLVEQGPWSATETNDELRRIQERLYACIDAAIDGNVAETYPTSAGKSFIVRLDGYNLPDDEVRNFITKFSEGIFELPDYKNALRNSNYVKSISFEVNLSEISSDT